MLTIEKWVRIDMRNVIGRWSCTNESSTRMVCHDIIVSMISTLVENICPVMRRYCSTFRVGIFSGGKRNAAVGIYRSRSMLFEVWSVGRFVPCVCLM